MLSQTITLRNTVYRSWKSHPIHYGVPWPEGAVTDANSLCAFDESGHPVPIGTRVLNDWPDGSIQWALLDFSMDFEPELEHSLRIVANPELAAHACEPKHPVLVKKSGKRITLTSGPTCFTLSSARGRLLEQWQVDGRDVIEPGGLDAIVVDESGKKFSLAACGAKRLFVEHATPLRAVLRIEGKHEAKNGATLLEGWVRAELCAGRRDVKLSYHFHNKEESTPGITVQTMRVVARTACTPKAKRCITQTNRTRWYKEAFVRIPEDIEIVSSDTLDIEHYAETHQRMGGGSTFIRNPESLRDPEEAKPWFMQQVKFRGGGGEKMTWSYVGLADSNRALVTTFLKMAGLHPKAISTQGSEIDFWIWPEWAGPLSITQGAGRTHEIMLGVVPGKPNDLAIQSQYLEWENRYISYSVGCNTVAISPDTEHVRRCNVFAIEKLPPFEPREHMRFERKVANAWLGVAWADPPRAGTTPSHAVGMWPFGDNGTTNNEEMAALPYFEDHLRSGRWACAEAGINACQHMIDVDHVAYSIDPYQNFGMCAHCLNHNDGAVYPSHMWFTELLFAYALTGDEEFKRTAVNACENLIYWINDPDGFKIIAADGREAGQPMINLTWVYQFNRDERYIEACRKIVREKHMADAERYGRYVDGKPSHEMVVETLSYGEYASWEGMFWLWDITRDEELKRFMLEQFEWRLVEDRCGTHGFHRGTDYNPAAYAYYMTGDKSWIDRVARPFKAAFNAASWPLGWIHSMYFIKLAFEMGIVTDEDVTAM